MTRTHSHRLRGAALFALFWIPPLFACGTTPESRFYVLTPTLEPGDEPRAASLTVGLRSVSLPSTLDRSQMVVSVAPNQRVLAEFDRWAGPLPENLTRVLEQDLEALLGSTSVYPEPSRFAPSTDYVVSVEILEFDAILDGPCTLRARFHLSNRAGEWVASHSLQAVDGGRSGGALGVAEAMSANLGRLAEAIAARVNEAAR